MYAVFHWKNLHLTEIFYTGTARGARDKYKVCKIFPKSQRNKVDEGVSPAPLNERSVAKIDLYSRKKAFFAQKRFWANFQWIFTRPFLTEGSSLRGEILLDCLIDCLIVRHHFNISNKGCANHPRIMSDPKYYTSLERGGHQQ